MLNKEMLERLNSIFATESVIATGVPVDSLLNKSDEELDAMAMEAVNEYLESEQKLAVKTVFYEQAVALESVGLDFPDFNMYTGELSTEAIGDKIKKGAIAAKDFIVTLITKLIDGIQSLFNFQKLNQIKLVKYYKLVNKYIDELTKLTIPTGDVEVSVKLNIEKNNIKAIRDLIESRINTFKALKVTFATLREKDPATFKLSDILNIMGVFIDKARVESIEKKVEKLLAVEKTFKEKISKANKVKVTKELVDNYKSVVSEIFKDIDKIKLEEFKVDKEFKFLKDLVKNFKDAKAEEVKTANEIVSKAIEWTTKSKKMEKDTYKLMTDIIKVTAKDVNNIIKAIKKSGNTEDTPKSTDVVVR